MFSFFSSSRQPAKVPFHADMHSHLIPGIDDGVKSNEQSLITIRKMVDLGYEKFVTTPHIMSDTYPNTADDIRERTVALNDFLKSQNVGVEVVAAAEYYLDEYTMRVVSGNDPLMTFGNNYLLFETNYLSEPYILKEFIFKATSKAIKPILAHPERYQYMTMEKAQDLVDRGVLLQVNLLSLSGFYGKQIQKLAEKLIENKMISFIGSDCHNELQAKELEKAIRTNAFKKAIDLPLLNTTL
ncbi:MAG TPA: CpsB/CapC family capsule biosynthesis tyrosine phosphatase [Cyclobacteriaceae bacterium]|nr:CpsB/CapC family capsule biosynthesis tyrosine phosphatase [Cyclobacteriaceae bacterium]